MNGLTRNLCAAVLAAVFCGCQSTVTLPPEISVVAFGSPYCLPCVEDEPALDTLGCIVIHVDASKAPRTAEIWGVKSLPTYVVREDGREVARVQTIPELREALRRVAR